MAKARRKWTWESTSPITHFLTVDLGKVDQTFDVLWLADVHWDNPKCNHKILRRHLDAAMRKDSPIFIIGDFFCAMQGKYDKRSNKSDVRPEHQNGQYLDSLVDTATDWLLPYKSNLCLISDGNHETSILERHETDLLDRLCGNLRSKGGIVSHGAYDGFIRQHLRRSGVSRTCWDGYYHHGWGGGGPVTKGLIDFNRLAEQVHADFFVMGHVHRSMVNENVFRTLNASGNLETRDRDYVRLSTYKQEAESGHGWAVQKGLGPRPLGGRCQTITMVYEDREPTFKRVWHRAV